MGTPKMPGKVHPLRKIVGSASLAAGTMTLELNGKVNTAKLAAGDYDILSCGHWEPKRTDAYRAAHLTSRRCTTCPAAFPVLAR